eukprot:711620-Pyramimonas_sp.AAC.2
MSVSSPTVCVSAQRGCARGGAGGALHAVRAELDGRYEGVRVEQQRGVRRGPPLQLVAGGACAGRWVRFAFPMRVWFVWFVRGGARSSTHFGGEQVLAAVQRAKVPARHHARLGTVLGQYERDVRKGFRVFQGSNPYLAV